jgi:DNA-binding beta-propeller fold protein YncE
MDAETLEVLATIPIADDFVPGGLTVDRSGRHGYLSGYAINPERSMVWVIDTRRAVVTAAIPVPTLAVDLALHPHERRLYVTAYFQGDALTVIDTRTNTVIDGPDDSIFAFRLAVGRAPVRHSIGRP